jgi:chaperone required for assembly of F1-ATPase
MTSLSGSAVLALAVARVAISPEAAWKAAHVDEDFQSAKWGEDEEAETRRAGRWREFEAAARVLRAAE